MWQIAAIKQRDICANFFWEKLWNSECCTVSMGYYWVATGMNARVLLILHFSVSAGHEGWYIGSLTQTEAMTPQSWGCIFPCVAAVISAAVTSLFSARTPKNKSVDKWGRCLPLAVRVKLYFHTYLPKLHLDRSRIPGKANIYWWRIFGTVVLSNFLCATFPSE